MIIFACLVVDGEEERQLRPLKAVERASVGAKKDEVAARADARELQVLSGSVA